MARRIMIPKTEWFERFLSLSANEPHHILLESGRSGRYSIMGIRPEATIEGKGNKLSITDRTGVKTYEGSLLKSLEEVLKPYNVAKQIEGPPVQGGAIGFVSYDVVREIEKLDESAVDDLKLPELYFLVFEDLFVYDHETEELWLYANGLNHEELQIRLDGYETTWSQYVEPQVQGERTNLDSHSRGGEDVTFTEEGFAQAVKAVQQYIANGDVFQVNLSVRHSRPLRVEPLEVYKHLRVVNPSPYMSYIHTPERQIVSASPELLVKKRGNELSARPIAGTRSRGRVESEDVKLAAELLGDEKERAEHVMLVDLERNDLGRVSTYGSVEVNELMVIERYSHVMHLVSNVKSQLAEEYSLYDCIRAVFPGGTITGAPKVRTMEIIEELEPVRRGLYTGAIGWIGFNGDMELNIVIRTMICQDGEAHVQAGAGIVIDSNPDHEYKESMKKAQALWNAFDLAEQRKVSQ